MPRRSANPRVVRFAVRTAAVAAAIVRFSVDCSPTHAVTTSWNTNSSGSFTSAANWDNGVPDGDDVAVFNRGFVAYEVGFPGGSIFDPPLNYPINYLRVRTNDVSFVWTPVPFQRSPSLSVLNPDLSIVVGEDAGEVAILNMAISSLSGANASIGRAGGATGTLNVGGAFNLSGALNVGEFGTGTMNVTNGTTVTSANGFIGPNAGSSGQVTVSGAGSSWTNGNSLTIGRSASGTNAQLHVNDGGVLSVTNVLQVNPSGRLDGNGFIQGNVQNSGRVAPGTSPGTLHIDGNYGQSGFGELQIELAAADSLDKLDIDGNLTVGGRLNVSLLGGYSPAAGATFDILDWTGTQNGTFYPVQLPPLAGRVKWDASQLYTSGALSVVPAVFQAGEFITYSQDGWGTIGTPASELLIDHFFEVHTNGAAVIGIPGVAGYSAVFSSAGACINYLPSTGFPGPLDNDYSDPTSTTAGVFGGYVLALKVNVDFNDAGFLAGSAAVPFGDLALVNMTSVDDLGYFGGLTLDLSEFNGLTVRQFLEEMNNRLGGGSGVYTNGSYSFDHIAFVTDQLSLAFEGGQPRLFAQDHLRFPGDFNGDLIVDAADYVVWRKTDGSQAGYDVWRAHFGQTFGSGSGSAAGAAVPEPTALALFLAGSLCLGFRRPRRT